MEIWTVRVNHTKNSHIKKKCDSSVVLQKVDHATLRAAFIFSWKLSFGEKFVLHIHHHTLVQGTVRRIEPKQNIDVDDLESSKNSLQSYMQCNTGKPLMCYHRSLRVNIAWLPWYACCRVGTFELSFRTICEPNSLHGHASVWASGAVRVSFCINASIIAIVYRHIAHR